MHDMLSNHGHRPFLKLVSFKAIVGIDALQDILFSALAGSGTYFPKPPYHVSWADFDKGIPAFILVWEMSVVSVIFLWSFTFEPFRKMVMEGERVQISSRKAFLAAFDVRDIWQGFKYSFTAFTSNSYLEGTVDEGPYTKSLSTPPQTTILSTGLRTSSLQPDSQEQFEQLRLPLCDAYSPCDRSVLA